MKSLRILPFLGRKTDVPANDQSMFVATDDGGVLTHDAGGLNFDTQKKRNACSKSDGYAEWSNSATAQKTLCMGLFELYDGTNRDKIFFDNGKCYIYDSNGDPVVKEDVGTTTFANTYNDLYSIIRIGNYMVFADRAEHTPYKWKNGDANLTKLAASGTEYKFRYLDTFQRRVIGVYSDQTDGNIDIRWSTDWPTTAITSLNFPAANQLWMPSDDTITGIATLGENRCYIYGENSICELVYYQDYELPFRIYVTVSGHGGYHNSIVTVGSTHYLFNSSYGFCMYRGGNEFPFGGAPISKDIEDSLSDIDSSYYDVIVGRYIPWTSEIVWSVPMEGTSSPTHLLFYNLNTQQWRIEDKAMRCLDLWTLSGATTKGLVYANTDGNLYKQYGNNLDGEDLDGYRIEPILDFGSPNTFKFLKEIWFDIGNRGNYNIDVYLRSGDTVGGLLEAEWSLAGTVSCFTCELYTGTPTGPPVVRCSQNARFHQIKWGTDAEDEPFLVHSITFKYTDGSSF